MQAACATILLQFHTNLQKAEPSSLWITVQLFRIAKYLREYNGGLALRHFTELDIFDSWVLNENFRMISGTHTSKLFDAGIHNIHGDVLEDVHSGSAQATTPRRLSILAQCFARKLIENKTACSGQCHPTFVARPEA